MTLGEGKRKVLMLLDEYSAGGQITRDEDIEKKMADFFDIAQKDMAGHKKILRTVELQTDGNGCDLPENCVKVLRVWKDGRLTGRYAVSGRRLMVESDTLKVTVEYQARPKTINENTKDEDEFEVDEDAANCLPFFVAAQHLMPDLVVDYSAFLSMYYNMKSALDVTTPGAGGGGIRQSMFGGRGRSW